MKRWRRRAGGLEVVGREPDGVARGAPLLFVHGAYAGAWCWDEFFLGYFAQRGYVAVAVSLRGHGGSDGHDTRDAAGVEDYVADVHAVAATLAVSPVLIGHSMGGIVVQRCARQGTGCALVSMASVPPEGLAHAAWALAARDPALFGEMMLIQHGSPERATAGGLQRALFSGEIPAPRLAGYLRRMQPESQRALYDLLWPQHWWLAASCDLPALVLGAAQDAFFRPSMIQSTARWHGVEARTLPDVAHAMMLDLAWERVAMTIADWLDEMVT